MLEAVARHKRGRPRSRLFVPEPDLLHLRLEVLLERVGARVVLGVRAVVEPAVGADARHVGDEEPPRHVVPRLEALGHRLEICNEN